MQKSKVLVKGQELRSLTDAMIARMDYSELFRCEKTDVLIFEEYVGRYRNPMVVLIFDYNTDGRCEVDIVTETTNSVLGRMLAAPGSSGDERMKKLLAEIFESKKWSYTEVVKTDTFELTHV